jgi:ribosomal protein S3AE
MPRLCGHSGPPSNRPAEPRLSRSPIGERDGLVQRQHATMAKKFTVRLPDDEATNVEALARAEGLSLNETVRRALVEAVEARRADPEFKSRVQRIIEEDRELLERLAR